MKGKHVTSHIALISTSCLWFSITVNLFSKEFIFKEIQENEISEIKYPLKITRYTVFHVYMTTFVAEDLFLHIEGKKMLLTR